MTFGEWVKTERMRWKDLIGEELSVYQLAKKVGVSDQTMHNLEKGVSKPSLDVARRLAMVFGCDMNGLCRKVDFPPMPDPGENPPPGRPRGRPRDLKKDSQTNLGKNKAEPKES